MFISVQMNTLRMIRFRLILVMTAMFLMASCSWLLLSYSGDKRVCGAFTETTTESQSTLNKGMKVSVLRNFTIVTGFFSLGSLQKGNEPVTRGPNTYRAWMRPYQFIENGVVAYFDDEVLASEFSELRRHLPTKVVTVNRSELWAFSTVDRTRAVFSQPDYPKNVPKSTNAEYVAAMHAKYELVARVANGDDPFGSSYIAWMDLGIYRSLPGDATGLFMLRAPRCLDDDAVMFARIFPMADGHTLPSVMRNGHDWVGGGFFIARRDIISDFCDDYERHVETYLNQNLANHDQSVLLAMYLPTASPRPSVPLQAIVPGGFDDPWFYMALQARRDGLQMNSGVNDDTSGRRVSCSYDIHS